MVDDRDRELASCRSVAARERSEGATRIGGASEALEAEIAERELAEQRFQRFFEAVPYGVAVVRRGSITVVNHQLEAMFVCDRDAVIGRSFDMLVTAEHRGIVPARCHRNSNPDDRGPASRTRDAIGLRSTGEIFPIRLTLTCIELDEDRLVYVMVEDRTESAHAAGQIRELESRYAAVADSTGMVLYDIELATGWVSFDGPVEQMTGYSAESLGCSLDRWLNLVADSHHRTRLLDAREALIESGRPIREEYRVRRRDGAYVMIRDEGRIIRDDTGRPQRLAGFLTDVTDQRTLEEQLRQSLKLDGIGRLAGGIAHDFNNLLTVIIGNCEFLLDVITERNARRDLVDIHDTAQSAKQLTRQLLLFSRREVTTPGAFDLNTVIEHMSGMLSRMIGEDVELITDLDDAALYVYADPGHMEQVILNLVVNARDAMPCGGQIRVETRREAAVDELSEAQVPGELPPASPKEAISLTVVDTGVGMDDETMARVFEPFFTTKQRDRGTGLGLSMVYGIAKRWGGRISVDSRVGEGTRMRILLPRTLAPVRIRARETVAPGMRLDGYSVLVVEDDDRLRGLTARVLAEEGATVEAVASGEAAIERLRQQPPFDLILTDVVMQHMNGVQLAAHVHEVHPEVGVLFMSGYPGDALVLRGWSEERTDGFIAKPFTRQELVDALVESRSASAGLQ